jgi:hypothetical protein
MWKRTVQTLTEGKNTIYGGRSDHFKGNLTSLGKNLIVLWNTQKYEWSYPLSQIERSRQRAFKEKALHDRLWDGAVFELWDPPDDSFRDREGVRALHYETLLEIVVNKSHAWDVMPISIAIQVGPGLCQSLGWILTARAIRIMIRVAAGVTIERCRLSSTHMPWVLVWDEPLLRSSIFE